MKRIRTRLIWREDWYSTESVFSWPEFIFGAMIRTVASDTGVKVADRVVACVITGAMTSEMNIANEAKSEGGNEGEVVSRLNNFTGVKNPVIIDKTHLQGKREI